MRTKRDKQRDNFKTLSNAIAIASKTLEAIAKLPTTIALSVPAADRFNGYFNAVICLVCFSGGGIVNCADL